MKKLYSLVFLLLISASLGACITEEHALRVREDTDHYICIRRGGDYEKCRAVVVGERKVCLDQWHALPPEEKTKINLQRPEARPPEIRACNAVGV